MNASSEKKKEIAYTDNGSRPYRPHCMQCGFFIFGKTFSYIYKIWNP